MMAQVINEGNNTYAGETEEEHGSVKKIMNQTARIVRMPIMVSYFLNSTEY